MPPLKKEILVLSQELQQIAEGNEDVWLLMTIAGIGYYTALLEGEVGEVERFLFKDRMASYLDWCTAPRAAEESRGSSIAQEGPR